MNALTRTTRRALAGVTAVALAATGGALVAPAAHAATANTTIYGNNAAEFDGVFRQSLAILGLDAAGVTPAPSAVAWLLDQQCADGGFSYLDPTPDGNCRVFDYNDYSSGEDVDSTAIAAQALRAVGQTAAATDAESWLKAKQSSDGGWESPVGSGYGTNANSTGVALMALTAAGITPTYPDSAAFLATKQIGQGITATADEDKGAFAPYGGPDQLATEQAVPGIGGFDLVDPAAPAVWNDLPTTYASAPVVNATNVAGWGSTWLSSQVDDGQVNGADLSWSILSFAATGTAGFSAETAYERLISQTPRFGSNPGALGLAALAATVVGDTDGAEDFAALIEDTLSTGPAASYALSSSSVWSGRSVTLTRTSVISTLPVTQTVNWGDGTSTTGSATSYTHTYTTATSAKRAITVSLADANASTSTFGAGTVTVTKDKTDPKVSLTKPKSPTKVSSWKSLKGTSSDSATGVKKVTVHLTEKRTGSWYAYNGTTWSKKKSSAAASKAAKRITVTPASSGAWSLKVAKLTKGTLKVAYTATDGSGNTSSSKTTTASLTKK